MVPLISHAAWYWHITFCCVYIYIHTYLLTYLQSWAFLEQLPIVQLLKKCVCVCIYICVCVCVYIYIYVCVCVCVFVCFWYICQTEQSIKVTFYEDLLLHGLSVEAWHVTEVCVTPSLGIVHNPDIMNTNKYSDWFFTNIKCLTLSVVNLSSWGGTSSKFMTTICKLL
jgi:hypothetical protein